MDRAAGVFCGRSRKHHDAFAVGRCVEVLQHTSSKDLSGRPHTGCYDTERIALDTIVGRHDAVVACQE